MDINVRVRLDSPDLMNSLLALAEAIMQLKPGVLQQEKAAPETVSLIKEEPNAISLEQVRERLASLSQAGKSSQVKALINKYGANKLTEVAAECYAALFKEAGAYIN